MYINNFYLVQPNMFLAEASPMVKELMGDIGDSPEEQSASTKLQAIQRGRSTRQEMEQSKKK